MFKKRYGFGESEYEHFPDGFKLPKMPSAGQLLTAIKEDEQAEREKAEETSTQQDEPDKK
ncbi:hypothetical protein FACS1894110_02130 [Spirochaetia bacterium]|nr:hypothetical protein FACS1894110_02130 [Spirochaetia bacterium]